MSTEKILGIYLDDSMRARAVAGQHNFMNRIRNAFESREFTVEFRKNSDRARLESANQAGYSLFHMEPPFHDRALTMRLAYFYPFWRLEASEKRWEFEIARTSFDANSVDLKSAKWFAEYWRKRLYGIGPETAHSGGIVYIPLQGRLAAHRSFQFCSPVEMVKQTLAHDQQRQVVATLHPNEVYTDAERNALEKLAQSNSRLTVKTGGMEQLLQSCDYIVTQNSSVAMGGFFHRKPSILFAKIDFHHISANVLELGIKDAFQAVQDLKPSYDQYLFWFLKLMSINAGNNDAEDQILNMVGRRGWEV